MIDCFMNITVKDLEVGGVSPHAVHTLILDYDCHVDVCVSKARAPCERGKQLSGTLVR